MSTVTNGDTDGFGVTFPEDNSHEEVVRRAIELESEMSEHLQSWCMDEFNLEESTIEMEAEKLMDPVFIPEAMSGGSVKKKYAYRKWWEQ